MYIGAMPVSLESQVVTIAPAVIPPVDPSLPFTFQSAGDANGIIYWLGTNYGAAAFVNPQTLSDVVVNASSRAAGALLTLTNRAAASPLYTNPVAGSWFAFDLGVNNTLIPNYYTLQHDNEAGYYLRNWKFQGSNNAASNSVADLAAATWTDLSVHLNDAQINSPDGRGAWAVPGITTPYRWLRVLQTGLNASGDNYLVLGEVEFYGAFTHVTPPPPPPPSIRTETYDSLPYTPSDNGTNAYFYGNIHSINDGDFVPSSDSGPSMGLTVQAGVFVLFVTFAAPVYINRLVFNFGQFNGNGNIPHHFAVYRGISTDTLLYDTEAIDRTTTADQAFDMSGNPAFDIASAVYRFDFTAPVWTSILELRIYGAVA